MRSTEGAKREPLKQVVRLLFLHLGAWIVGKCADLANEDAQKGGSGALHFKAIQGTCSL